MNLYKKHQQTLRDGCFTTEYFLRGMTLAKIYQELGLQKSQLRDGAFIVWARETPGINEFELGGWAEHSTDNFVNYVVDDGKALNTRVKWNAKDYSQRDLIQNNKSISKSENDRLRRAWNECMRDLRVDVSESEIDGYKRGWLETMKSEKLIKIIPVSDPIGNDWPKGGKAAQIIVTKPILCEVVDHYKANEVFRGVYR